MAAAAALGDGHAVGGGVKGGGEGECFFVGEGVEGGEGDAVDPVTGAEPEGGFDWGFR